MRLASRRTAQALVLLLQLRHPRPQRRYFATIPCSTPQPRHHGPIGGAVGQQARARFATLVNVLTLRCSVSIMAPRFSNSLLGSTFSPCEARAFALSSASQGEGARPNVDCDGPQVSGAGQPRHKGPLTLPADASADARRRPRSLLSPNLLILGAGGCVHANLPPFCSSSSTRAPNAAAACCKATETALSGAAQCRRRAVRGWGRRPPIWTTAGLGRGWPAQSYLIGARTLRRVR